MVASAVGCGDGNGDGPLDSGTTDAGTDVTIGPWFETGDEGVSDPLASPTDQARAGRATAAMLPEYKSRLQVWEEGDFILANDRVALVIEDVGPSDLYDPWGGRPVGLARVEGGFITEPADFGEFFILMDRMSIVTEYVGVVNDGTDGQAAVVRAQGRPAALPFLDPLLRGVYRRDYSTMPSSIDYVLEPGAEHVDIFVTHIRAASGDVSTGALRGFMYGPRMPPFFRGFGFRANESTDLLAFADDDATSWAYAASDGSDLGFFLSQSGFTGMSGPSYSITGSRRPVCTTRASISAAGASTVSCRRSRAARARPNAPSPALWSRAMGRRRRRAFACMPSR